MMQTLYTWIRTIAMCTLLLSMIQALLPQGTLKKAAGWISGLILLVILLTPLKNLDSICTDPLFEMESALEAQETLNREGQAAILAGIAERTEAYISEQAAQRGLTVTAHVEVELQSDHLPVPVRVELYGPYSAELSACIQQALNIPPERQVWHEGIS